MELKLERIARALERIADSLESVSGNKKGELLPRTAVNEITRNYPPKKKPTGDGAALIAAYCDAFKARYGMNPPIDGKTAGLALQVLKTVPLHRAAELVQAYLQMDEQWFKTKCHDFPTFVQNLTKVAVALFNGTGDPHEKNYWQKVFGGNDGQDGLHGANPPAIGKLRGEPLQGGAGQSLLAGVLERTE